MSVTAKADRLWWPDPLRYPRLAPTVYAISLIHAKNLPCLIRDSVLDGGAPGLLRR